MTATVVLVHGAWHSAWCWDPVLPLLDAAGVPALALDLPGHGDDVRPLTDLHGHGDAIRAALDTLDAPVVLVGHSYGGAAITDAGTHPSVQHLVYISAFCIDAHESVMVNDLRGGAGNDLEPAMRFGADNTVIVDPQGAIAAFYDDCDPAIAADAVVRLGPESLEGFAQTPRAVAWRQRPSSFALCTADRALTPALQRDLAARCDTVVEWPTSHSPFLSRPELVADLLSDLAHRVRP